MSWHVSFFSRTKSAAIERIQEEQAKNSHFPLAIATAIIAAINWLPQSLRVISVTTTGSAYDNGGSASMSVQLVDLLE